MRSIEDVREQVHREATRRRNRRRSVVSTGVAVVVLVLAVFAVRPDDASEVSISSDGPAPVEVGTTSSTTPGDLPATTTTASTIPPGGEQPEDPAVDPGPTTTGPDRSGPDPSGADPTDEGSSPTTSVDPRPSSKAPPTTVDAGAPVPTTPPTTTDLPVCTAGHLIAGTPAVSFPADDPTVEGEPFVIRLGYTILVAPDAVCRTVDGLQSLTIRDADGDVVWRYEIDSGTTQVIDQSTWYRFNGSLPWDPRCVVPLGGTFSSCSPVGAGTYTATIYDQGFEYAPVTIEVPAR